MSLKGLVLKTVKPTDYYAARFPKWNPNIRGNVKCCFHTDNTPSLALALNNGGARCHASSCKASLGNIVHFESEMRGIPEKIATRRLYSEFIRKVISLKEINKYREALAQEGNILLKIQKEMGLNASALRKFSIGYDTSSSRVTIPVFNEYGLCVNIRYYKLPSMRNGREAAKLYNKDGYGAIDLFPLQIIDEYVLTKPIYLVASEKEAMLCCVAGLQAVSSTAGEGSWDDSWQPLFEGRDVIIVFDIDSGGTTASKKTAEILKRIARSVTIVTLPFRTKRNDWKDLADWLLKDKHDIKELQQIAKGKGIRIDGKGRTNSNASRPSRVSKKQVDNHTLPEFHDENLYEISDISSKAELLNSRIRTQGIVAARSPNTFSIPWKFRVKIKKRETFEYEVPIGRDLLRFVRSSDGTILQQLQNLLGNNKLEATPIAYITATEVEVIPIAAVDRDVTYVVQRCYYFGSEIKDNIPYYLEIIPTSEVRTQETIGIITHCAPVSKTIDKFELTEAMDAEFTLAFSPEGGVSVWDKLVSLANDLSQNHTRVYNRLDWHLVALLTWSSPIGWRFPDEPELQRGWFNSLALGDTETGKSKVSKAFQTLFNCGVFVNAENCTYVGLVGGAIKMGSGQLMLRWGRIPLSDRQLVVLEELSGLSTDDISNMSEVRSSGIARLDKGGINSNTTARTRLLCLSNVRGKNRSLSGYLSGVKAIQELIGHAEDIARFDLITTLTDNEVNVETINTKRSDLQQLQNNDNPISASSLRDLMHFIWSLTPDQIKISKGAHEACLEQTKILSADYHPSIPIFKGGSGRYKLARIAASIACIQFSYSSSARRIVVKRDHVLAAVQLLRHIYDKPSFGYRQYSIQMFGRDKVEDTQTLERAFKERIPDPKIRTKTFEALIHLTRFTQDEFMAIGGLSMFPASQLIGFLLRSRVIRKGDQNVWEITPPGKIWMETFTNSKKHQLRKP